MDILDVYSGAWNIVNKPVNKPVIKNGNSMAIGRMTDALKGMGYDVGDDVTVAILKKGYELKTVVKIIATKSTEEE